MTRDNDTDEDLNDDTSETGDKPTISERIIARYPADNWTVIDDDTLRLEVGDAFIEVGAYVVDEEDDGDEIRADMEINHPRGLDASFGDIGIEDWPAAIGQGLAMLHALDLATTGEPSNVDVDTVPAWAVKAFANQADAVSYGMDDLSERKTDDADRYARRFVLAERERQMIRKKWGADHDAKHNGPKPALAAAAWWLTLTAEAGANPPEFVPAWAVELKNKVSADFIDPEERHEVCCIKAAALLLAEIARCRRARMKQEAADRAAEDFKPGCVPPPPPPPATADTKVLTMQANGWRGCKETNLGGVVTLTHGLIRAEDGETMAVCLYTVDRDLIADLARLGVALPGIPDVVMLTTNDPAVISVLVDHGVAP